MAGIVDISRTRAAARSRTPVGEPEGGPFGDEMEVAIGVEQGRIDANPVGRIRLLRDPRPKSAPILTPEQFDRLCAACDVAAPSCYERLLD